MSGYTAALPAVASAAAAAAGGGGGGAGNCVEEATAR